MKPLIYRLDGLWYCVTRGRVCGGPEYTPKAAYDAWLAKSLGLSQ